MGVVEFGIFGDTVAVTCDGGAFLSSSREGGSPEVGRIDASGNLIWRVHFSTGDNFWTHDLVPTRDGGVAGCGIVNFRVEDAWVMRLDSRGNVRWARVLGGSGQDRATQVVELNDGSLLLAGFTRSFGAGGSDLWLIKFDPSGNIVWQKTYGGPLDEAMFHGFKLLADGGGLLTGRTSSFGAGSEDAWFLRVDAQGEVQWQFTLGGSAADRFSGVDLTRDDGFLAVGRTATTGAGSTDAWVVRLDPSGNVLWQETIGSTGPDLAQDVVARDDGTFAVFGYSGSYPPPNQVAPGDLTLTGIDESGSVLWHRIYGTTFPELPGQLSGFRDGSLLWTSTADDYPFSAWTMRVDASGLPATCWPVRTTVPMVGTSSFVALPTFVEPVASSTSPIIPFWESVFMSPDAPVCSSGRPGEVSPPFSPEPLMFESPDRLRWEAPARSGAAAFDLYRGDLGSLASGGGAECLHSGILEATWDDPAIPLAGEGWFYLVRGTNSAGVGTLGYESSCAPRSSSCEAP